MATGTTSLQVLPDAGALAEAVARAIVDAGRHAVAARGHFAIALAGGDTPRAAYELLGSRHAADVDWTRVHVYFTDERFVPPTDARNNHAMAQRTWLSRVDIPATQVHAMPTTAGDPATCAEVYERVLRGTLPLDQEHTFDVALMGIGTDGHTASLFPGDERALAERERWVLAVRAPAGTEPRDRITLTLPVLNRARRVVFVASGAAKHERVAQARAGLAELPAALVHGIESTEWLIDAAAA